MRCNLHTHTTLSDGELSPEDLVEAAIDAGITHLGITDHFQSAKLLPERSVQAADLRDYVERLRRLAQANRSQITLYVGLEIDFARRRTDLAALSAGGPGSVPWELFDFVLFEYVNDRAASGRPFSELVEMRPFFPCAVGLAHNDLSVNFRREGPDHLARLLKNADIFVELNAAYGRPPTPEDATFAEDGTEPPPVPWYQEPGPFTDEFFDILGEEGVEISVANDTHGRVEWGRSDEVDWALDDLMALVRAYGLEDNLIVHRLDAHRGFMPKLDG